MLGHIFDKKDHDALQYAAQLVNEVIERNRETLTLPAMQRLCEALNDMQLAEKMMDHPEPKEAA